MKVVLEDPLRLMHSRLCEAFGVKEEEIHTARDRLAAGRWSCKDVAVELENLLVEKLPPGSGLACPSLASWFQTSSACAGHDAADLKDFLSQDSVEARRPCATNTDVPCCAMLPRLRDRTPWLEGTVPALHFHCHICEAE